MKFHIVLNITHYYTSSACLIVATYKLATEQNEKTLLILATDKRSIRYRPNLIQIVMMIDNDSLYLVFTISM